MNIMHVAFVCKYTKKQRRSQKNKKMKRGAGGCIKTKTRSIPVLVIVRKIWLGKQQHKYRPGVYLHTNKVS